MVFLRVVLGFVLIAVASSAAVNEKKHGMRSDVSLVGRADGKMFFTDPTEEVKKQGTDFLSALEFCRRVGLKPASITSLAQNNAVVNGVGSYKGFWLPLTDLGTESEFRWIGTGEVLTYENWSIAQPAQGSLGTSHNCVYVSNGAIDQGTWYNSLCNGNWRPLCEIETSVY